MRLATSKLTDAITVQPTAPESTPITIGPNDTVDLDRVIGQTAEVRDGKKVVTPAQPVTLGAALGPDLLRAFDIDPPRPASTPAAATRGADAPSQKEK